MTGPVYITIGGKERKLRYDINAAADMEELMGGKSLLYVLGNPMSAGFSAIRVLLWGGLKHADKGLTLQRVGVMMQDYMEAGGRLETLAVKISDAVRKSKIMGEETDVAEESQEQGDLGNGQ
jgi:hypothetical protein